jgi:hypothetical protein
MRHYKPIKPANNEVGKKVAKKKVKGGNNDKAWKALLKVSHWRYLMESDDEDA